MIEIANLCKFYDGRPVLDDVTLTVREGSILGLLGPNGAGKTTLVSILTGIIPRDRGRIRIDGLDPDRELKAIRSRCSIVPQTFAFYPTLTVRENLEYFGALYGLEGPVLRDRVARAVEIGSLQSFLQKRAEKCSGGMKRRLNLAIGLLHDPRILYLDEPTVGVDTQSRNHILGMIGKINREQRTTIVYTSHYMDEIEQISDDIAIIDEGRIVLHDRKETVLTRTGKVAVRIGGLSPSLSDRLRAIEDLQLGPQGVLVDRNDRFCATMARLFALCEQERASIEDIAFGYRNLEALFLTMTSARLRDH